MRYYLAITIGPILKTIQLAKTTRELWVASYFLSKLTKLCIDCEELKPNLLSPQPTSQNTFGAGVYPDRVYWQLDKSLEETTIEDIQTDILTKLSKETSGLLTVDQLLLYLKIYWLQISFSEDELNKKSFLFRINEILDGLELQDKWEQSPTINIITQLIGKGLVQEKGDRPVYRWRKASGQTLLENKYADVGRFPSMMEITTRPLKGFDKPWYQKNITDAIDNRLDELDKKDKESPKKSGSKRDTAEDSELKLEDDYMAKIKEKYKDSHFRSSHKYVCIIQSDGDGVGNFLRNKVGNDPGKFKEFSDSLNEFAIEASKEVADYGGMPVFSGGDDLLFFAPVQHQLNNGQTIINLVKNLNDKFKERFSSLTQSFGISVTYYKYPMAEAITSAYKLLRRTAKKQPCKNYIAMKVQKHSGQSFNFGFRQEGLLYECFLKLSAATTGYDPNFLNSVMYKLDDQKIVINTITSDKDRLKLFFDENFNEPGHADHKDFFEQVGILITETFNAFSDEELSDKMNRVYSALRFVHFLNAKDTNE